jgi:hypothetical protein
MGSHPTPRTGEVTVKRGSGFGGSACLSRIFVDGRPVGDMRTSEKVVLYLPEGEQILSAWPRGVSATKAVVKSGAQSSFKVGYESNGDVSINLPAF